MRVGLYGGSFDPIHIGHLLIADIVREQKCLDEVVFLPAAIPPHKQGQQLTSANRRLAMLELAISGYQPFLVNTIEMDREGVSYTVDTLEAIHSERPADELFLILGGDSLGDLPRWKSPARICELATPVVVARPNAAPLDAKILQKLLPELTEDEIDACLLRVPVIDISSTSIRVRVAHGQSIRFRTPRAVEKYIEVHELYQSRGSEDVNRIQE
ncbi:MAG: nicotinate-nucleotide adenylyltransferase [Pirellulaceae bacterium]